MDKRLLFTAKGISKRFGGILALNNVSLELHYGERVAIMGENGAGKSTMMKIIAGVYTPDSGSMALAGQNYAPKSPFDALNEGVSTVFQEPSVFPHLSVLENLFMGRHHSKHGWINSKVLFQEGKQLLARMGLPENLLGKRMSELALAQQQMVLIAKTISMKSKLLILDEPTSILTDTEAEHLFEIVNGLAKSGIGVFFITHRFDEISEIADRFIVLRDGKSVGQLEKANKNLILTMMSGDVPKDSGESESSEISTEQTSLRYRSADESMLKTKNNGKVLMKIHHLCCKSRYQDINLDIVEGKIIGLYGLIGAGRTELALSLIGELPYDSGSIEYLDKPFRPIGTKKSLQQGIAYLPEDRKTEGILQYMDTGENLSISLINRLSTAGVINIHKEASVVSRLISKMDIKVNGAKESIQALSGGNQQKVLLARLMATKPKLLILDEPTRGIDVPTKTEIHKNIRSIANQGQAILLISSELSEMIALSDEIHTLHEGTMTTSLTGKDITERSVLAGALGIQNGGN